MDTIYIQYWVTVHAIYTYEIKIQAHNNIKLNFSGNSLTKNERFHYSDPNSIFNNFGKDFIIEIVTLEFLKTLKAS